MARSLIIWIIEELVDNKNEIVDDKVGFISYGSGSKAKIFQAEVQLGWKDKIKSSKLFESLKHRKEITFEEYHKGLDCLGWLK